MEKYNVFSDALVERQGHMPAVPDPQGKVIHAIFKHFDVTEITRAAETIQRLNGELEVRVAERTSELRAALKQLESFSYTVSHDLCAPLRAIDGFAHILEETQGPRLDPEGARLGRTDARLGRTDARLGRTDARRSTVDMTVLAGEVADEPAPAPRSDRLDIRLEPLPRAMGDPALLRQVRVNLIANALKLSSRCERAVIEVSGGMEGGEAVYRVRDNGTGFDMQFAGKLFGVFQRRHGRA